MKKTAKIVCAIALALVTQVVVAADRAVVFSSAGPDRYADGTYVQPGENYVLVWIRTGCEFAGVDLDCNAVDPVNNAVFKNGRAEAKACKNGIGAYCKSTLFQVGGAFADSHLDGRFALLILDTRVADASGALVLCSDAENARVNGWGLIENATVLVTKTSSVGKTIKGAEGVTDELSAIPEGVEMPLPTITSVRVEDGYMILTVKGTNNRLLYNVAAGETPEQQQNRHAAVAGVQGETNPETEITIIAPATENQMFCKVVRN